MYTLFLFLHVSSGILAIVSGFSTLFVKKGSKIHKRFGFVFVISMTITGAGASWLGYFAEEQDMNDVITGILTMYLVLTSWMAAKRQDNQYGVFEVIAFAVAVIGSGLSFAMTISLMKNEAAQFSGVPSLIFSSFITLAALLDLRLILKKGLSGAQRMVRHVWRMCMSLFIATGSFFLGQMQILPEFMQNIAIVSIPVILVLVLMIYWMIRVLFTKMYSQVS